MFGRGFLLGVAVGCVRGVYVAPHLGRQMAGMGNVSESILAQVNRPWAVPEKGTWPTDDQAKTQLFKLSKWDLTKHGNGSKVRVNRCIGIAETELACELLRNSVGSRAKRGLKPCFKGKTIAGRW
jgi:hypothetical protein